MKTAIVYDKWLTGLGGGEVVACNMARTLKDNGYEVVFACGKIVPPQTIQDKLGVDLSDITFKQVLNEKDLKLLISPLRPAERDYAGQANHQPLTTNHHPLDLFINVSFMDYSYGYAKRNIFYVHFPTVIRSFYFNIILAFFKTTGLHGLLPSYLRQKSSDRIRAGIFFNMKKRLDSYDLFITHSKYVSMLTKKYWNKEALVLYPPVSLITNHPTSSRLTELRGASQPLTTKQNWICSVGRFFTLGHGKKQEIMIEAFKKLIDSQSPTCLPAGRSPITNLQLHFIGGVGDESSSIRFVESLKKMVKGYPIIFHFNVNRKEVEEILMKSKIYWHAAGYGEDPEKDPVKFEHFGIAPVEAISAGCLPMLFKGGGLVEIAELIYKDNADMHLFTTIDELIEKTNILLRTHDSQKQTDLILTNIKKAYSQEVFEKKFMQYITEI